MYNYAAQPESSATVGTEAMTPFCVSFTKFYCQCLPLLQWLRPHKKKYEMECSTLAQMTTTTRKEKLNHMTSLE